MLWIRNGTDYIFNQLAAEFFKYTEEKEDPLYRDLLEAVSYRIMKMAVKGELV